METILHFKDLFNQAFKDLKRYQAITLKIASIFLLSVILASVIGFVYRFFTGFFTM
jgi:hypothetical protein